MTWEPILLLIPIIVATHLAAYQHGRVRGMTETTDRLLPVWMASESEIFMLWKASLERMHAAWKRSLEEALKKRQHW